MHKILVVEDDTTINQVICEFLKENHYEVTAVFDGAEALRIFEEKSFDLIVLDVMLPSMSGLDVLKEIRKTSQVPVMMLTALDDEYTQLVSFNHLISDYVTKPFSPLILMKRIENIFRSTVTESEIIVGDLRVSVDDCTVYWQEEKMSPTKKEYEIIQALAKRKNHLVTRDQLMNTIWGYSELDSRVLDNHVKNIRKKIPGIPLKTWGRRRVRIAKKHFLLTGTIIFIVVTMVLATLYFVMPVYYDQVKHREAKSEFSQIAQQVQGKPSDDIGKLLSDYNRKNTRVWFSILDAKGKLIYPRIDLANEKGEFQLTILPSDMSLNNQTKSMSKKIKTAEGTTLTLRGEYSLQPISDANYVLLSLYPYILFFSLALGGVAAFLYSRFATKRIKEISESTRKMATLSPDVICPVKGHDEISNLAQDINTLYQNLLMSIEALRLENEKVAESEREKAEFLRMTSHELKTPITSMMGIVDGMIYGVGDFKDKDKYLHKCREILEEQSRLVQSILAISKIEMRIEAEEEEFSLKQLLEENLNTYKMLADMKGYKFIVHLEELYVQGNKMYLLKAIKNLLDNAFHYALAGGEILLIVEHGRFIIENDAEHVLDEQQIQKIFQPFYRPDYSRNRKDGGTGLGLFIVQQILEKHNLHYCFEAVDGTRMRFTIFFSGNKR